MAHLLGIAHPPSYPLYLLLAKGASLFPLPGDVAWRINVLTALLAAAAVLLGGLLAVQLVYAQPAQRLRRPVRPVLDGFRCHPAAAALAAALSGTLLLAMPRLWTLALEAEVFSLHLTLAAAFWLALLKWQDGPPAQRGRWLLAAALLAGLGLANHRTFLFLALAGLVCVLLIRPRTVLDARLVGACLVLAAVGLSPYLYVIRGLRQPVAFFSPSEVRRLGREDVWYVLQGNATGETAGGRVVLELLADPARLRDRAAWLTAQLRAQFGPLGSVLLPAAALGLAALATWRARWVVTSLAGSLGAALFAMAYGKYPDADRYLLPLELLLALGLATIVALALHALARPLRNTPALARGSGALAGLVLGGYCAFGVGVLAGTSDFTRGGYVYHTLHNLDGVEQNAVVCSWWASAWGWWYAQYVDGHRRDVTLIPQGPDDCVRDVLPEFFGRRPVYVPALTPKVRDSEYVFFPSRDLWLAVARRAPLSDGALMKGPDERIYLYRDGQRRWVPSLEVFAARGFQWDMVQLTPDYVLRDLPDGPPLTMP